MHHTALPDTFTISFPLTVEIVLELMDSRHSGQSGIHGAMTRAALDTAVKDTFGDQYSFDMIHLWFVIRSVQVECDSNSSYRQCIVLCCEKREEMILVT